MNDMFARTAGDFEHLPSAGQKAPQNRDNGVAVAGDGGRMEASVDHARLEAKTMPAY
jgi:hypothetical protein